MANPYIAIANGSPCVFPSLDRIKFFLTKSLDGLEYEFCIAGSIDGHIFAVFFQARFPFRVRNLVSVFSYFFLSV